MKLSTSLVTYNWRLKLAALGLAVLIWAVVSSEQVTSQWIPVRVDPVVRDPEYVLSGPTEPAEVRVQFTGPGRELWELALDRPALVLPLSGVGDRRAFPLDPSMLRVPAGMSVRVQDIRPAVVRVDLERLSSRVVPVQARIGGRSLERYDVGGDLEILPPQVRVTGPADRLEEISALTTEAFEIVPDTDSTFTRSVGIDTAGLGGLTLSRTQVRVSGSLDLRTQRALGDVRVAVPPGLQVTPARVQVTVHGPQRRLQNVFAGGVRAVVPRDSLPAVVPPGGVEAPLVFEGLPPGVTARPTPLRVRVQAAGEPPPGVLPPAPAEGAVPPAAPDTAP